MLVWLPYELIQEQNIEKLVERTGFVTEPSVEEVPELLAAKEEKLDFAVDIYPYYGSDVDVTLCAGYDIRHGLIGPGVYASHGYERSHIDGVKNTLKLLINYCE